MQFSNVFVIYDSTARGYLTAVAMDAQTEQALDDFSGVADAARFGSVDAALSVLSGLEHRFKGHHLHAAPLDNANPVIKLVIRRPGFAAWKEMPTRDMRRARHERKVANDTMGEGHGIVAYRADGATEWIA